MDVNIAFFIGYFSEEIYMDKPERHVAPRSEKNECKLIKPQYDLK